MDLTLPTELQTVYVLTNPAMPGIIKIGMTRESDAGARIAQLSAHSGVPLPFDCVYACNVPDARTVEKAFHFAFSPDRLSPSREFFRVDAERVVALLKLLHLGEDITAKVEAAAERLTPREELESSVRDKQKRRPKIDYLAIGLNVGDTITFKDGVTTAAIAGPRTVIFNGVECSLQNVTQQLMPEFIGKGVESKSRWCFKIACCRTCTRNCTETRTKVIVLDEASQARYRRGFCSSLAKSLLPIANALRYSSQARFEAVCAPWLST